MTSRLLAALGAVLVVAGLLVLMRADAGLVRDRASVAGIPVTTLSPPGEGPFPGVVVAHGFSGSGRLMDGIGIAFAQAGWVAAMPDLAGHGANPQPLGEADLPGDVLDVLHWLEARDDVGDVAMLGHSMGAGAVTQAAVQRRDVPLVALSLPSADDLPEGLTAFFLVGSAEPARFAEAAQAAGELGYDTETVRGAEHISILFRTQTLRASVEWLDAAVGQPTSPVTADWRMLGVAGVYLGSALLLWPLSSVIVRTRVDGMLGRPARVARWVAVPLAGVAAGGVLAVVPSLGGIVPLLVGGYLAAFFALSGLVLWALSRRGERPFVAAVVPGSLLGLYAGAAVAIPAQLGWAQVSLAGQRGLAFAGLAGAILVFSWAELALHDRYGYWAVASGRLLLTGVLAGLAVIGAAPGFLLLLVPVVAVVLTWFGSYGVRVARLSGSPLAGALTQTPSLALLVTVTTPLA